MKIVNKKMWLLNQKLKYKNKTDRVIILTVCLSRIGINSYHLGSIRTGFIRFDSFSSLVLIWSVFLVLFFFGRKYLENFTFQDTFSLLNITKEHISLETHICLVVCHLCPLWYISLSSHLIPQVIFFFFFWIKKSFNFLFNVIIIHSFFYLICFFLSFKIYKANIILQ